MSVGGLPDEALIKLSTHVAKFPDRASQREHGKAGRWIRLTRLPLSQEGAICCANRAGDEARVGNGVRCGTSDRGSEGLIGESGPWSVLDALQGS
jgi:hypothetical protein